MLCRINFAYVRSVNCSSAVWSFEDAIGYQSSTKCEVNALTRLCIKGNMIFKCTHYAYMPMNS